MLKGMDPTSHGIVLEKVLDLCGKRDRWSIAYRHPDGHRTSNMLDRLMRGRNRSFDLSFTHISLLTEVLTVINLAAIFHNTVHLFKLSTEPNENTITV